MDVEVLLIGWLQEQLGDGIVIRDELDNNLLDELPTVQVERVGGTDDGLRLDHTLVDIDVYAATRGDAADLAAAIRGLLLGLPGSTVGGAVIGRVRTEAAPISRPYENLGLRRVGGTYSLYLHPVS
ncbi:hypothetical protein AB0G60_02525 [Streptomyces angustmyceticus]|uniref:hypothetical protein n=1 Tax=Streptomyces angustmyceticus TaxID=285578 RepID=UPI001CBF2291|nr:hypothetical protein [Streptomyces angustmyceticus]